MNIEDLLNATPGQFHPAEIRLLRDGDEVLIRSDKLLNIVNAAVSAQRTRIHQIGMLLEGESLEQSELIALGKELTALAGLCAYCGGDGMDDDGEGLTFKCKSCDGSGLSNGNNE